MAEKYFKQPSVMSAQQHFAQVPAAEIQRSRFDRSHALKTTFDAGRLIPIFVDEVLPGDTFSLRTTAFSRLATPLRPFMDNLYMDIHYFFVPNRLIWTDWQAFMGERRTPDFDPNTVIPPYMPWAPGSTKTDNQTIMTYMGLPRYNNVNPNIENTQHVSCLPLRAYQLIYNEWYRDENLVYPAATTDGSYDPGLGDLDAAPFPRFKRHDYFTSCLPWPQKGDPVTIPIAGNADVYLYSTTQAAGSPFAFAPNGVGPVEGVNIFGANNSFDNPVYQTAGPNWPQNVDSRLGFSPFFPLGYADMSDVSSVTVNDLRTAFQIQKLLERDARGGTRYIELILSHFGVRSDDARLQRPEFLGGGTQRINVNPIASTAVVPDEAPQANLAGVGTGLVKGGFTKSFTEHGIIIGLASVRADLTYQNGIERMWQRRTRYDYYWPALAHLGEQAVYNKEINYYGQLSTDNAVFGYQERYAEYRYKPSKITGLFNSKCATPLDTWHLAQDFAGTPGLNQGFLTENPPIGRISAVPSEPDFLCDIWHDLKCDRPMPVYSVPGLIDHF